MDPATARSLIALNNLFYSQHAASFSATRSAPWDGWKRLIGALRSCERSSSCPDNQTRTVLDLACGNLRFEQFLTSAFLGEKDAIESRTAGERHTDSPLTFHAVDCCPALVDTDALHSRSIVYHEVDILERCCNHADPLGGISVCDLSVCFGFMHHVPGVDLRKQVLSDLLAHTKTHGLVVISFWQFMHDERLARKALQADEIAQRKDFGTDANPPFNPTHLDENDHFLGWQSDNSPLRYCHHFSEAEIDELVASMGAGVRERKRYSADGASGNLNRYLVLEKL